MSSDRSIRSSVPELGHDAKGFRHLGNKINVAGSLCSWLLQRSRVAIRSFAGSSRKKRCPQSRRLFFHASVILSWPELMPTHPAGAQCRIARPCTLRGHKDSAVGSELRHETTRLCLLRKDHDAFSMLLTD